MNIFFWDIDGTLIRTSKAGLFALNKAADDLWGQPVNMDVIEAAGSVAMDTLPGDEPVDICQVVKGEHGVSHFMIAHIPPFYERRWGSFLRDLKNNRII